MASRNLPRKCNLKALHGLEAVTGSANFDIAEAVWLKLMAELADDQPTIALLCKTAVARAVLEFADHQALPVADATIFEIDASRWFGALGGGLLAPGDDGAGADVEGDSGVPRPRSGMRPVASMGFRQGRLVADSAALDRHAFAVGTSPVIWRQGRQARCRGQSWS